MRFVFKIFSFFFSNHHLHTLRILACETHTKASWQNHNHRLHESKTSTNKNLINIKPTKEREKENACIPRSGTQFCREGSEEVPSNWRPRRSREWYWRWHSCTSAFPKPKTATTIPALCQPLLRRPTFPVYRPSHTAMKTGTDRKVVSVSASRQGPLFFPQTLKFRSSASSISWFGSVFFFFAEI